MRTWGDREQAGMAGSLLPTATIVMNLSVSARRSYYGDRFVQERIAEFFGGATLEGATAVYFAAGTEECSNHRDRLPLEDMPGCMRRGAELNRSLWDRHALLAHLDIEHVNFDDASCSFLDAGRIFDLQKPVAAAVETFLASFGIHPLHILTGRGHHFVWQVAQTSAAFSRLGSLGHLSSSLRRLYGTERAPTGEQVAPALGAAFAGLGLVMEFVAHHIKAQAAPHCEVPVELGAIETGGSAHGREIVAVDITEYADPLCSRVTRVPFSVYLKPGQSYFALSEDAFRQCPPLFVVPMGSMTLPRALRVRQDAEAVKELANDVSVRIPDVSVPMERLIAAYQDSALAHFHEQYYSEPHDSPEMWPQTYDRTPLDPLPACARLMLEHPNDLLLRPGCVQRVVRVMLALGWHPRHIAGLIRSKYERDFGWNEQWHGFDPATRADFYARVFSGLFFTGVDDLVDFNCQSAQEEGLCFVEDCHQNLQPYRNSLLDRRSHERLARRSIHRMFLPEEHL